MLIIVDGLSRSGKLFLGKILLTSKSISTQTYTGYLERLIETIYFDFKSGKDIESHLELLRLYFCHTLEDLRKFRLLSLNPIDSSYYRNSNLYRTNKKNIDLGVYQPKLDEESLFINHTHESIDFLSHLVSNHYEMSKKFIRNYVVIIRNPSAQILSWINRKYTKSWSYITNANFKLNKIEFKNNYLINHNINYVPWFLNQSFRWITSKKILTREELEYVSENEIIAICVIFLLEKYLIFSTSNSLNKEFKPIFVKHESIHDSPKKVIKNLFQKLGVYSFSNSEFNYIMKEISSEKFGLQSAETSLKNCQKLIMNEKIKSHLFDLHHQYKKTNLSI